MAVSGQGPVTYSYDNANRLTKISQGSATVTLNYDQDGRRVSMTLPNGVTASYGYDAASRLTGITYTLGSTTLGNLTYAYDAAGRRTVVGGSFARTGTPQAASAATYNANNQLTQWKGASLAYDANGNLTSDGTNTYTWNARNQLVAISGGASASFQYDAFGRRVSKAIGGTTQYLYDGANPVQEISGTTASANLLTGGVDEYFQRTDSAGARNFLTDALGSTLALADSTGTTQTLHLRAVRQHRCHRRSHDQQLCLHRPRTRPHRPLLLPRQILQPRVSAIHQRGPVKAPRWFNQSLLVRRQ